MDTKSEQTLFPGLQSELCPIKIGQRCPVFAGTNGDTELIGRQGSSGHVAAIELRLRLRGVPLGLWWTWSVRGWS